MVSPGTGLNLHKLCKNAASSEYKSYEYERACVQDIATYLHRWLRNSSYYRSGWFAGIRQRLSRTFYVLAIGRRHGNYIVALSLVVKVLYLVNAVAELLYLDQFLTSGFTERKSWIRSVISDKGFAPRERFPRVSMCDVPIRQLQNVHLYTVQCVLPINRINVIIFIFMWFWFIFLTLVTFASLVKTSVETFSRRSRYKFVRRLTHKSNNSIDKTQLIKFCDNYLRHDGIFVLKMLRDNSDHVFVHDVTMELWNTVNACSVVESTRDQT